MVKSTKYNVFVEPDVYDGSVVFQFPPGGFAVGFDGVVAVDDCILLLYQYLQLGIKLFHI